MRLTPMLNILSINFLNSISGVAVHFASDKQAAILLIDNCSLHGKLETLAFE